jgi:Bacterial regulatory proteins, tetR family
MRVPTAQMVASKMSPLYEWLAVSPTNGRQACASRRDHCGRVSATSASSKRRLPWCDEAGLDALTTRALGHRLGVAATAVYRYFRNKDELINALGDRIIGSGTPPLVSTDGSGRPRSQLRAAWIALPPGPARSPGHDGSDRPPPTARGSHLGGHRALPWSAPPGRLQRLGAAGLVPGAAGQRLSQHSRHGVPPIRLSRGAVQLRAGPPPRRPRSC